MELGGAAGDSSYVSKFLLFFSAVGSFSREKRGKVGDVCAREERMWVRARRWGYPFVAVELIFGYFEREKERIF